MKRLIVRFSDNSGFSLPVPPDYQFGYGCFDFAKIRIQEHIDRYNSECPGGAILCTYIGLHLSDRKV